MKGMSLSVTSHEGTAAVAARLWWKRPLDLVLAIPMTLVSLPLILALALAVRIDSSGPAFFRQDRVGRYGARFRIWKLRSMVHNADSTHHSATVDKWFTQSERDVYKSLDDPRITRLGRFLRHTNLDELPQLFNVLCGHMSLVGPRPAIEFELQYYQPGDHDRQLVRPGITGVWQISDREHIPAREMMRMDIDYVHGVSPLRDLRILAQTALLVLRKLAHASL